MGDRGYVLIVTLIIMSCLLVMGIFLLDHFLMQTRINNNLYLEMKTYYLVQAGIEYIMYRLNEDPTWRTKGYTLDLNGDGEIHLEVAESGYNLLVYSTGKYQEYHHKVEAYLTQTPPVRRIK